MSHYFTNDAGPMVTREVDATIFGIDHTFTTANGVFSGSRLDLGTSVLLRTVAPPQEGHVLDLGCGFGSIAVGVAAASPGVTVDAVDVNERALLLTERNAEAAGVAARVAARLPHEVGERTTYDQIWSNPPIRVGKARRTARGSQIRPCTTCCCTGSPGSSRRERPGSWSARTSAPTRSPSG